MVDVYKIPGINNYGINKQGEVYNIITGCKRESFDTGTGYLAITIKQDGQKKNYKVHRLMALTFLPLPTGYTAEELDVGHKDDNPQNNNLDNLYWCTRSENLNTQHFKQKAKKKIFSKVRCVETGEVYDSMAAAARAIGKHYYGINLCLLGKQKTCGGYHWQRVFEDNDSKLNKQDF